MKRCDLTAGMRLWLFVGIWVYFAQPGLAEDKILDIPQLSDVELPVTSAQMLVQQPTPTNTPATLGEVVSITGVKAKPTEKGVEVILETTAGDKLQVANRSTGNNFIADITGGQLRLANGEAFTFKSEKPLAGITEITVTNVDANTVRVTVVGEKALPVVELFDDNTGLIFTVASTETATKPPDTPPVEEEPVTEKPQEKPDDAIELVVTGEQDGYNVPNASTATRTDTPLRDIPQSIQVVPQKVIRDQGANRLQEILENVPGITGSFRSPRSVSNYFNSRGFPLEVFRNGAQDTLGSDYSYTVSDNIERVEVLKGPASVLFGLGTPGGTANVITKKPLREPFYEIEATVGSFDAYRGAIDFSGPLDDSKTVLYRLNASANTTGSFIDFFDRQTYLVAPSLTWQISEQTKITFDTEYQKITGTKSDWGLPAEGSVLPNPNGKISRNRYRGEPSLENDNDIDLYRIGYDFEHRLSENWRVRSSFQSVFYKENVEVTIPLSFLDNKREQPRLYIKSDNFLDSYQLDNYVVGKFSTGNIKHELVAGFNLYREDLRYTDGIEGILPTIDVFNPVYGAISLADLSDPIPDQEARFLTQGLGLYLQNQITLAENLKVLLGGRFDLVEQEAAFVPFFQRASQQEQAFSPRVGIVYQPIKPISLYASYSGSFSPAQGRAVDINSQFKPERGTQYEIGVKADVTERLSATLALFHLTRSNVVTTDPNNPLRSIQTGEQRSQGVELDLSGEILPGWNIFAGFSFIDAEITEDNTLPIGNQLNNTPRNSFNLWTTYEIQSGSLQGLGFGLGIFYAGERQGDLDNSFQLPSYVRTDAALFYKRNNFRAALNLKNLFDVEYFASSNGRNNVYLGDPFTVQGTLAWEF